MKKRLILLLALACTVTSCKQADYYELLAKRNFKSFSLSHELNTFLTVDADRQKTGEYSYRIILPHDTGEEILSQIVPTFEFDGYALFADGKRQTSGVSKPDFTKNRGSRVYTLYSYDGKSDDYTITVSPANVWFESVRFLVSENSVLVSAGLGDIVCEISEGSNAFWFAPPQSLPLDSLKPAFSTQGDGSEYFLLSGGSLDEPVSFEKPQICRLRATTPGDEYYIDYQVGACRLNALRFNGKDNGFGKSNNFSVINMSTESLMIELPEESDLASLVADFDFSGGWIKVNGVDAGAGEAPLNFGSEASIVVGADNSTVTKAYTLTIKLVKNPVPDSPSGGDTGGDPVPDSPSGGDTGDDPVPDSPSDGDDDEPDSPGDNPSATFAVLYDANGASGTVPGGGSYTEGAALTIQGGSALSLDGYTFCGWNTSADGSGNIYAAGLSITMPAQNLTLYAIWKKNLSVTYNGNLNDGGTAPVDMQIYFAGGTIIVKAASDLSKTGRSFDGWCTMSDGSGTRYAPGASFTIGAADVKLYALWAVNTYTVTFDSGGGSSVAPQIVAYGATLSTPSAPTRTGYTFAEWYRDAALTNAWNFSTNTIAGATTLYAKWNEIPVTNISFTLGGSASSSYQTYRGFNSVVLSAVVTPADALDKTLTWTLESGSGVTLSGSGNDTRTLAFPGAAGNTTATIRVTNTRSTRTAVYTVSVNAFYEILGVDGLNAIRDNLCGHYKLTSDITIPAGTNWTPIGRSDTVTSANTSAFSGVLDGAGQKIIGMSCSGSGSYWGLIGINKGTVKNLHMTSVNLSVDGYSGSLVGLNTENGIIEYCSSTGTVTGTTDVGGLVGSNEGSGIVRYCYSGCSVTVTSNSSSYSAGGLIGNCWAGTVNDCYATGSVTGPGASAETMIGGFTGQAHSGTISYCYSTGAVSNSTKKGGFSGSTGATFTSCYFNNSVNAIGSGGGNGLSQTQMQSLGNFSGYSASVWAQAAGTNSGYPHLIDNQP